MDVTSITKHLLVSKLQENSQFYDVGGKVIRGERISAGEAVMLYEKADLGLLSLLASIIRTTKNGDYVYFNRNFHIEPTNICVYNCGFCSYHKLPGEKDSWVMSIEQISSYCRRYQHSNITEVHVVGGVHPKWGIKQYCNIIKKIREILPAVHIKAFSAIELYYIFSQAKVSFREGFKLLKQSGLNSIPGGGAEIFNSEIRRKICPDKPTGDSWLKIHEAAHQEGIPSNATILYGHIESYKDRVEHMAAIRDLQDKTGGFNCFIPLRFRSRNNRFSYLGEVNNVEDLRNFAVARIFLDNIPHLKAYWPMLGKESTRLALSFGVDDLDGTIDDTTKIYSMAGAEEQKPIMTEEMFIDLARGNGRILVERDSTYKPIHVYSDKE